MSYALPRTESAPLASINTTPLIDVLLVLLVMLVFTLPPITNSVSVDLPSGPPAPFKPKDVMNRLVLTDNGALLWNGNTIQPEQLDAELQATRALDPMPELQLAPEANASYDLTARVINQIKQAGISKFGFVGNERFRSFGKSGA